MPMFDNLMMIHEDSDLGHAGSELMDGTYTSVDTGITTSGINLGGKFGLHLIVTEAFTDLDEGCILWITHGASTSPTTKHTGMFVPVAALTLGAYFFVPAGTYPMLRHICGYFEVVSTNATLGEATAYLGPGPLQARVQ